VPPNWVQGGESTGTNPPFINNTAATNTKNVLIFIDYIVLGWVEALIFVKTVTRLFSIATLLELLGFPSLDKEGWRAAPEWLETVASQVR
jgi:hypothetical protein